MPAAQRVGDSDSAGGTITSGVNSVRVNNQAVSVDGSPVSPHSSRPVHVPVTAGGVGSVKAGGRPINVTGNADTCGHVRTGGSENVKIG